MAEQKRRGLLHVQMDIAPEHEDELNTWYWQEHLPERLAVPGFLSGRRFEIVDGGPPKYLAIYDLEDVSVLDSPEYQRLINPPDPRTKEIGRMLNTNIRRVYVEIPRLEA
ncbi:conserved hypothetical protein [Microbacterium sp. C448]|uniref:DUF4286 family protein n=1 Tax=Microbacterium TaxID=33882 RepID=UPI0003DE410A|nr:MULTISPECIES: DUF4286 family protein [Microbacterium]CDJ99819.1 conserved hypothetical protein [Microbacterium sp. C448]